MGDIYPIFPWEKNFKETFFRKKKEEEILEKLKESKKKIKILKKKIFFLEKYSLYRRQKKK